MIPIALSLGLAAGSVAGDDRRPGHREPLVIARRRAAGCLPEHTLESCALAIDQAADFNEPVLVATKDGRIVVRQDVDLAATTNVDAHPELARRQRTTAVDGVTEKRWFVSDFTRPELQTLRIVQRYPDRAHVFDGR